MTAWWKSRRPEPRPRVGRRNGSWRAPAVLCAAVLIAGCTAAGARFDRFTEGVGYYWQTITGHLAILQRAEPVGALLAQSDLDPRVRQRLELAQEIRRFAVTELELPDNGSYTRFADLHRPFVTWGVVAAPELSLRLTQWCFPVAGCVTYRGYYSLEAAERYAARLEAEGLDVQINGVPAYSTLGWLDDPLLSTFINYPDAEVARLVFHELSHQVVYAQGDSMFNESFASTVEQLGVERWLKVHGTPEQRLSYLQQRLRRDKFLELLGRHREALAAVYAARTSDAEKREAKRQVFEALKAEYRQMRDGPWAGFTGYDRWFSRPLGNAHLGSVATYTTWVPVFRQLFAESGEDFGRFYVKVGELAALNPIERHAFLLRRSDKLMGDELLDSAAGAEPIVAPLDARGPPEDVEATVALAAARRRTVQDLPARDQVLHLRERDAEASADRSQLRPREPATGATIRAYQ